ncbi:MAG: adenine deaminase [Bdellovibrionota bacterium]
MSRQLLQRRIDAAQGRVDCDLLIRGIRYLDVFSCEWRVGELGIIDGVIVGVEPGLKARQTLDAKGAQVVPGFIDAHVHLESSLMIPRDFERAVLPKGTTTAICDPHELANVLGVRGIQYFLESASRLNLDLRVMLSSCVPATTMETNGGGTITAQDLLPLAGHPRALGLAEMMNMPGVLHGDKEVLAKLEAFSAHPIDGHCPLLRGQALSAYAAAGISSCHETSQLEEAREKLRKGIAVWIREGSVAKDLDALAPLLTLATSTSLGFCTDDRNPLDIATEGHLDHLIRGAIKKGALPEVAYRAASWSVARHYGLDRGLGRVGAIAPGYRADLVLLDDSQSCAIREVFKSGVSAKSLPDPQTMDSSGLRGTIRAEAPELSELLAPEGQVHVIGVLEGKIITEHRVERHDAPGVARLSVQERYGNSGKPANGYVRGFGENFRGAIASSVGHDSHNLIVVGDRPENMRVALAALIQSGGGFCVVRDGSVIEHLELPYGGLMSDRSPAELRTKLEKLKAASRAIGCALHEPFLQLAFLSLPVIPSLKLTDRGLVDVDRFEIISVRSS